MHIARAAAVLTTCTLLVGCAGPSYYAQAISGHFELMAGREDIDTLLADPATAPALRRRLEQVQDIRAFAVGELGLPDSGSYTQLAVTGRDAATWNVVAAPEFSLEPKRWCFLVAGCFPYRGYYDAEAAERLAGRLSDRGLDVAVSPALAYSTLGWFDDPLLDTMLRYGDEQLAAYLFHELAHQQVWVRNDANFGEAYASFVEDAGVERWLLASGRAERLVDWRRRRQATEDFDKLMRETRETLAVIYRSGASPSEKRARKATTFEELRARYRRLVEQQWQGRDYFGSWFESEPNNARLALYATYHAGYCAFARLYHDADGDFGRFTALARESAALDREARRRWLEQPCEVIAPRNDL